MKGLGRILFRFTAAAIGVGIFLLLLNLVVFVYFVLSSAEIQPTSTNHIEQIANGITRQPDGSCSISAEAQARLDENFVWAMLLDDAGTVVWQDRMPKTLPTAYSAGDVSSFSRWYLEDYPVHTWSDADGLLVLASTPGSEWKYNIVMPTAQLELLFRLMPLVLTINLLAALLLALFLGWRMYRSASPIASGIAALACGEAVELSEKGVLGQMAAGLNRTSSHLLRQQALLNRRDRTRTEWIAGISHDIRTPLSLVQGNAAQLESDTRLPEEARRRAERIRLQSQRISRLISDLNLTSKLAYAMQPLRFQPFSPAKMLRDAAAEWLNGLDDAPVSLAVDIPPACNALVAQGDEHLLRRAVENLLRNCSTHNSAAVQVRLRLTAEQTVWRIVVADNGTGLPPDVLARLRHGNRETLPTHGLGLTLVQQIVQAHGGSTLFSNTTPGLQVTLVLPIQPPNTTCAP